MGDKQNTYHEFEISNTEYQDAHTVRFPFIANKINILNDEFNELEYSFNGRDRDGVIKWDDISHDLSDVSVNRIWFKTSTPTAKIRIFAWAVL